uniref:Uncharacterized protein n=1 Tax=Timema douglasi TaxID=61478 RepID=A0A7R8ZBR2_TIMDO|nr:unnamed protein product [Timema douglasi]
MLSEPPPELRGEFGTEDDVRVLPSTTQRVAAAPLVTRRHRRRQHSLLLMRQLQEWCYHSGTWWSEDHSTLEYLHSQCILYLCPEWCYHSGTWWFLYPRVSPQSVYLVSVSRVVLPQVVLPQWHVVVSLPSSISTVSVSCICVQSGATTVARGGLRVSLPSSQRDSDSRVLVTENQRQLRVTLPPEPATSSHDHCPCSKCQSRYGTYCDSSGDVLLSMDTATAMQGVLTDGIALCNLM